MFSRSLSSVALLAVAALHANAQAAADCSRNYTVVAGDTCDAICQKENVSSFQLANVNPVIDSTCQNLFPDEELCLGVVGQDCTLTHTVVTDETCVSIAAATGTTVELILENNPNVNSVCSNIRSGEVLCVAATVVVSTST
ncbi:uncharacterized protein BXZ73DRAFT_82454 [Epithele typhae]|uniref:uncharacterized protein n=1 Tax=Epithele typhae TaxID=378194 RepID=UPI002007C3F3|nr:uncharacterized protein BXZ73DRAFT_82892 [Epithele typhae]XP_047871715.1 uncharacterized protein BXZ73DRAFT_82454 [Epithele typhae]KAH9911266.1 hypothetical protein BXZ73DRAFT_82892 [Epithele typhae]KAH9912160.1 hypothetical protein BXZ73DRAFT_82454 [Epithele typhae]